MWCIAGAPHLLAPPFFPDLRHVASSKYQPVFLASSNSYAPWVGPFLDHEQHGIRDTVPFVFAFTITAYEGVWHLMGSDGCFLIGLMKDGRDEQTINTHLHQFIEKRSLPCTETSHRHTPSLLLTLHLSFPGSGWGWAVVRVISSSSRCTPGLPSAPLVKVPNSPKAMCTVGGPRGQTPGPVNL